MNTSYDTLTITINADSKQANTSIKALYTNLRNLEETAKNLDDKRIGEVKKLLQGIAKIDFSNVSKGLQDVVNAFKAFQNKSFQKAMNGNGLTGSLKDGDPNFTMVGEAYSTGLEADSKTWQETIEALDKQLPSVILSFREMKEEVVDLEDVLAGEGFNGDQIRRVMSAIHQELKEISPEQLEKLKDILIQFGASADQADNIVSRLAKDANKLDGGAKKGANGLKKLINQFKNIMKYRIIRKIIQEIYKALSEGINNLASFDDNFAQTINELKSKFEFVKNSFGALVAPLIQMVAPLLEAIMTIVGEINNAFADMFAGFNGAETFSSATDEVKDFNKELKKTQSLGIDELNVLNGEDKGGFETKQTTAMSSVFKDALGTLKEIIDSIKPVLLDVVQSLRPLLQSIGGLLKSIMPIFQVIVNLINQLVGRTAEGVNKSLSAVIKALSTVFEIIGTVLKILEPILSVIIEVVSVVINIINDVITVVANLITDILNPILALLKVVFNVISPLLNTISNLLKGVWKVAENIIKVLNAIPSGAIHVISQCLVAIAPLLEALINILGFKWVDKTPAWVRAILGVATGGLSEIAHFLTSGHFATGGFPQEDGFFYANHNELVGQFTNGQTAVANNAQIVEGIKQGVLEAMQQANSGGKDIIIQIDGKEVAKAVNRQNANSGYAGINGGYKYGY